MKTIALCLAVLGLLAGCGGVPYSDPYASPDLSKASECERGGGYWHSVPAVCEQGRR